MISRTVAMWQTSQSGVLSLLLLGLVLGCSSSSEKKTTQEATTPVSVRSPAGHNSSLPYLIEGADGQLYFSWVERKGDTTIFQYAQWQKDSWSVSELIAKGTDWFVNWADYPMLAVRGDGKMLAHFLAKSSSGTYSYDVNLTSKPGNEWSDPIVPHDDGTQTEHGFVTMIPDGDQSFYVAWLDGRNTAGGHEDHRGAMTLRTAVLDLDGNLSGEYELDDRVCDCCQTTGAMTSNGPIFVYRDRSELEVRDMSIVRQVDGEWTAPKTIHADNWKVAGCPVNGPRADAIDNNVVVAWFSGAQGTSQVKVIFSQDGGETFGEPLVIDNQGPLGRVDVVMLDAGRALVSWLDKDREQSTIKVREVGRSGTLGQPLIVARGNESRGSGFPQMAYHDGEVWFAWTDLSPETSKVKVIRLPLAQ